MVSSRAIASGWWLASYVVPWALVISLSILLLALVRTRVLRRAGILWPRQEIGPLGTN